MFPDVGTGNERSDITGGKLIVFTNNTESMGGSMEAEGSRDAPLPRGPNSFNFFPLQRVPWHQRVAFLRASNDKRRDGIES